MSFEEAQLTEHTTNIRELFFQIKEDITQYYKVTSLDKPALFTRVQSNLQKAGREIKGFETTYNMAKVNLTQAGKQADFLRQSYEMYKQLMV